MFLLFAAAALAAPTFTELQPGVTLITAEPWMSNAVLVEVDDGLVLVDTPPTVEDTRAVLARVRERYGDRPLVAVNTHWHVDASGGNAALIEAGIPVWGHADTAARIREDGSAMGAELAAEHEVFATLEMTPPDHTFRGKRKALPGVVLIHPGHAHSADNIVAWFPEQALLFGGCAVKTGPDLGNVAEAHFESWDRAMARLQRLKPARVVQGHGPPGHPDPLAHTRALLAERAASAR